MSDYLSNDIKKTAIQSVYDSVYDKLVDLGRSPNISKKAMKKFVMDSFIEEFGLYYIKRKGLYFALNDWFYGLCFCSPLLESWCPFELEVPVISYLVDWLLSDRIDI